MSVADLRLKPIADAIADGRCDVLSVDIFDTLIWRRVPEPKDIFAHVAAALANDGLIRAGVSAVQFTDLRSAAEKAARAEAEAKSGSREVVLTDIYDALPGHLWTSPDARTHAIAAEVACEAAAMVLDEDVVVLMRSASDAGVKVILTSDTYFTREQLTLFLDQAGLAAQDLPDTLYISNEYGRPKWRDLFDLVMKDLNVPAEKVIHVGDNYDADVAPCVIRGISHVHYDKWLALPRTRSGELPGDAAARAEWIADGGCGGLTGLRSRLSHRPPPSLAADRVPYWAYGAAVLAPLFACYARFVAREIAAIADAKTYGVMREGRFLDKLVGHVAPEVDPGELWLSRRAVVRASVWPDDVSLLPHAITYCTGPTTDDVLDQLGLSRADLIGVFQDPAQFDIHAAGGVQALLTGVSNSPALREKIATQSARLRANLLAYLESATGLESGQNLVLLDLGYAGTIQATLQRILEREGKAVGLTGLYVAVNGDGRDRIVQGADLRALLSREGYAGHLARLLERTPDILEHACVCPEGSLDSFDGGGVPVLLPSQRSPSQIEQMEAMQDGILNGVRACMTVLGEDVVDSPAFLRHAAAIVAQAMLYPTAIEVDTIGGWLHEVNFDLADQRALADLRIDPARIEYGGPAVWTNLGRHEAYWPQAALARIAPGLATAAATADRHGLDAGVFTSAGLLGDIVFIPDLGIGPDQRRAVAAPLAVSAAGRGEMTVPIKAFGADAFTSVTIAWPKAHSIVSLALCGVVFQGEGVQNVVDLTGKVAYDGDMIAHSNFVEMGPNGAAMRLDLGASIPSWPHSVSVVLRFTYARLGQLI